MILRRPWLGGAAPPSDARRVAADFCVTMLPATVLASVGFAAVLHRTQDVAAWEARAALGHLTVRPMGFAMRWAVVRAGVDGEGITPPCVFHW